MDMNLLPGEYNDTTSSRKATKSRLVWRAVVLPWHAAGLGVQRGRTQRERAMRVVLEAVALGFVPAKAAERDRADAGLGSAVFSSTQNTAACCGGSRYRPILSPPFAFELRNIVAGSLPDRKARPRNGLLGPTSGCRLVMTRGGVLDAHLGDCHSGTC